MGTLTVQTRSGLLQVVRRELVRMAVVIAMASVAAACAALDPPAHPVESDRADSAKSPPPASVHGGAVPDHSPVPQAGSGASPQGVSGASAPSGGSVIVDR